MSSSFSLRIGVSLFWITLEHALGLSGLGPGRMVLVAVAAGGAQVGEDTRWKFRLSPFPVLHDLSSLSIPPLQAGSDNGFHVSVSKFPGPGRKRHY